MNKKKYKLMEMNKKMGGGDIRQKKNRTLTIEEIEN